MDHPKPTDSTNSTDPTNRPGPALAPRRLTSMDLIGLIVAVGLGLGAWRLDVRGSALLYRTSSDLMPRDWEGWFFVAILQLAALASFVVARSVRWPCEEQRRPGIAGCWGAVIVLLILIVQDGTDNYVYTRGPHGNLPTWELVLYHAVAILRAPGPLAGGVLVAWWLASRSSPAQRASGPLDRLGLGVGLGLVVGFLAWSATKFVQAYYFYN